ncbi:MAG TPA: ChbG/HpnK family deacetylase [Flavihumibacter sp.]|nr:ChbG/HpnK family deacetylase [Flavihumibacter sp.]
MKSTATLLALLLLLTATAQPVSLPRSTPEAEGVSSAAISKVLDAFAASKHQMHSIMLIRHGKVIAEGWWKPYDRALVHTMYSCSKSFTATAMGFAVAEGKISLEDRVISFFPDQLPTVVSENLKALRVRDLLSMSVGHENEPPLLFGDDSHPTDWVRVFLAHPVVYPPGTRFLYNSAATYMCSAILQKVIGEKLIDYLRPRLWEPLGITGIDWETDPKGINTGGWGLRLKTEDMAKFGWCFLNRGQFNGRQVIPANWVDTASSRKIWQDPSASEEKKAASDWLQGYCFQMWRGRHNTFRADGAFGQYIIMMPDADAVAVITSETSDLQDEQNILWENLLPAFEKEPLKPNKKAWTALQAKLGGLSIMAEMFNTKQLPAAPVALSAVDKKTGLTSAEGAIDNKVFGIVSTDRGTDSVRFDFSKGKAMLYWITDSVRHEIALGNRTWLTGTTTRKGPNLAAAAGNSLNGLRPFRVDGMYTWVNDDSLLVKLLYTESPHTETVGFKFAGTEARLSHYESFKGSQPNYTWDAVVVPVRPNAPKLVIRGDDMGYAHSGNLALVKSYRKGIETTIEVIAASPWFPEAAALLAETPQVEVGLHFAITSEWDNMKWRPLTAAPSLRDADGYFWPMLWPNKNYPGRAVQQNNWKLEDIEAELRAQIQLAKKYIPRLNHLSGHMGSLIFDPKVEDMMKRVAAEYGLMVVDAANDKFKLNYYAMDLYGQPTKTKLSGFVKGLDALQDGKNYIYIEHPGLDNAELRAIHHIGYENVAEDRQGVTDLFTSPAVKKAIISRGIKLVKFADL